MNSFQKLFPYVWPFRKQLLVSIVLGLMVAGLWGANLSFAFPVIKILLEQKNLHDHIDEKIEDVQTEEAKAQVAVTNIEKQVAELEASGIPATNPEFTNVLRKRAKAVGELTSFRDKHFQYQWVKTHIMPVVPQNKFQTLFWLLVIVLMATAVKGLLIFFQEILVGRVAELTVMELRKKLYSHVLHLDYQSLSHEGTSGLMSRFTYDGEQLAQGITLIGGRLIREPLKCLACMFLALYINWRLTLLSVFFIPLLGLFLSKFGSMLKRASRRMMESMSHIYKVLDESFFRSESCHRIQQPETPRRSVCEAVQVVL